MTPEQETINKKIKSLQTLIWQRNSKLHHFLAWTMNPGLSWNTPGGPRQLMANMHKTYVILLSLAYAKGRATCSGDNKAAERYAKQISTGVKEIYAGPHADFRDQLLGFKAFSIASLFSHFGFWTVQAHNAMKEEASMLSYYNRMLTFMTEKGNIDCAAEGKTDAMQDIDLDAPVSVIDSGGMLPDIQNSAIGQYLPYIGAAGILGLAFFIRGKKK